MSRRRSFRSLAVLVGIAAVLSVAATARAQEPLTKAKALYAAASYEEALTVLSSESLPEAQQYKALCMLALGRVQDATRAIEQLVTSSPAFQPSPDEVPPRFVTLVSDAKKKLLPAIALKAFGDARDQFKNGDRDQAMKNFDLVLTLASSPGFKDTSDAEDLRTLASGFIELARANDTPRPESNPPATATAASGSRISTPQAAPAIVVASPVTAPAVASSARQSPAATSPVPASPPPTSSGPSRPISAPSKIVAAASPVTAAPGSGEVSQAVVLKQTIPPLPPGIAGLGGPTAAVRVVIGVDGKVTSASIQQSSHPLYDRLVLQAAREWSYTPAMLNGQPVASEKVVAIQVR